MENHLVANGGNCGAFGREQLNLEKHWVQLQRIYSLQPVLAQGVAQGVARVAHAVLCGGGVSTHTNCITESCDLHPPRPAVRL